MKTIITNFIGFICITVLTGCVVHTSLVVKNESGQPVYFKTAHTGKTYSIGKSKSAEIEHTMGALDILTANGNKWHYKDVTVPGMKGVVKKHKMICIPSLKLYLLISSEGTLYVLPHGQVNDYAHEQPAGFPMHPEKE